MANRMLVTGGAGFIGINTARYFIREGWDIALFDNFSRRGTNANVAALSEEFPGKFRVVKGDVRYDWDLLEREVSEADVVIHLAAQVAVTTSVVDPRADFETNALGTLNVLEAIRLSRNKPFMINASTNKVYGALGSLPVKEEPKRYRFISDEYHRFGVPESQQLDFHSPYGVSKGAADQYTIDYSRIYGLKTVSFRQSCIYGTDQFGVEDQGWLAWFTIAAMTRQPITVYGTGKQVRDVLFVDDLIKLYHRAIDSQEIVSGKAYNIGGSPGHTLSLLEFFEHMGSVMGYEPQLRAGDTRPGDQPIFVADVRKATDDLGWIPEIAPKEGLAVMHQWMRAHMGRILKVFNS